MKTSLAIVLATIALTFGAMLAALPPASWPRIMATSRVRWAYPLSRSRRRSLRPRAQALIVEIVRL